MDAEIGLLELSMLAAAAVPGKVDGGDQALDRMVGKLQGLGLISENTTPRMRATPLGEKVAGIALAVTKLAKTAKGTLVVFCDKQPRDGFLVEDVERALIEQTLAANGGHREKTAKALGIGVRTLGMKLKKYREADAKQAAVA